MQLSLGFSPCPNDTFIFDALIHGRIKHNYSFNLCLEDVERLNQQAFQGDLDITKLSFHAWAHLADTYQMMSSGSALGFGVGPLLISKSPISPDELKKNPVAIPGKWTTANFLLDYNYPEIKDKKEMLFSDIESSVLSGECIAGVIIHENRFTYQERGFHLIADLGAVWEQKTKMAIPLGGIAIKRSMKPEIKNEIQQLIKASIEYAYQNPRLSLPFISENAQEMEPAVMRKHIDLYVNEYSLDLKKVGKQAVEHMLSVLLTNKKIESIPADIFV